MRYVYSLLAACRYPNGTNAFALVLETEVLPSSLLAIISSQDKNIKSRPVESLVCLGTKHHTNFDVLACSERFYHC